MAESCFNHISFDVWIKLNQSTYIKLYQVGSRFLWSNHLHHFPLWGENWWGIWPSDGHPMAGVVHGPLLPPILRRSQRQLRWIPGALGFTGGWAAAKLPDAERGGALLVDHDIVVVKWLMVVNMVDVIDMVNMLDMVNMVNMMVWLTWLMRLIMAIITITMVSVIYIWLISMVNTLYDAYINMEGFSKSWCYPFASSKSMAMTKCWNL